MLRFPPNKSTLGNHIDLPELRDWTSAMRRKLEKLFDRDPWVRAKLNKTRAIQGVCFVLLLIFSALVEWFVEPLWLRAVMIPVMMLIWIVAGGMYGNRTARELEDEYRSFVRSCCADGRPRNCLQCDYDLRGSNGATCPECGAIVPHVK